MRFQYNHWLLFHKLLSKYPTRTEFSFLNLILNMTKLFHLVFISLLALCSLSAQAQMRKCVTADGKSIYTDAPCASKVTGKSTEVKDTEAIKRASNLNGQLSLEKSCWVLSHRNSQCYRAANLELETVFKENCTLPIKEFERTQEQTENNKKKSYSGRYYSRYDRYEKNEKPVEADDLEYANRYVNKSRAVLQCESIEKDMWDFVKRHFANKVSAQDTKAINHKLKILPTREEKPWREY